MRPVQSPAAWAWRTARDRVPVPGKPAGGRSGSAMTSAGAVRLHLPAATDRRTGGVRNQAPRRVQRGNEARSSPQALQGPLAAQTFRQGTASGPLTRSRIEVRSNSRRTWLACRSSTSASRYSPPSARCRRTHPRTVPSGCPASDSTASRSPAAHPSVRSCNNATVGSVRLHPWPRSPASRASLAVNRRSGSRISASSPSSRSRCRPSQVRPRSQHELQLFWRTRPAALSWRRAARAQFRHVVDHQPDPVLQRHQVLQQPLGDGPPVQVGRRGQLPHQDRPRPSGAARPAPTARTAEDRARRGPPIPKRRSSPDLAQ